VPSDRFPTHSWPASVSSVAAPHRPLGRPGHASPVDDLEEGSHAQRARSHSGASARPVSHRSASSGWTEPLATANWPTPD